MPDPLLPRRDARAALSPAEQAAKLAALAMPPTAGGEVPVDQPDDEHHDARDTDAARPPQPDAHSIALAAMARDDAPFMGEHAHSTPELGRMQRIEEDRREPVERGRAATDRGATSMAPPSVRQHAPRSPVQVPALTDQRDSIVAAMEQVPGVPGLAAALDRMLADDESAETVPDDERAERTPRHEAALARSGDDGLGELRARARETGGGVMRPPSLDPSDAPWRDVDPASAVPPDALPPGETHAQPDQESIRRALARMAEE